MLAPPPPYKIPSYATGFYNYYESIGSIYYLPALVPFSYVVICTSCTFRYIIVACTLHK